VGGLDPEIEIRKFLTQIPERSKNAWKMLEMQGVIIDINEEGKAAGIERLRMECEEAPNDGNSDGDRKTG
jgi:calcineurin-like phosphoesterase